MKFDTESSQALLYVRQVMSVKRNAVASTVDQLCLQSKRDEERSGDNDYRRRSGVKLLLTPTNFTASLATRGYGRHAQLGRERG